MSAWRSLLDQLMRERGRALFGYAYALTGDRYDAEDLLQDALVRAFRSGRTASSLDAAHVYVKRAIATAFIDRSRRAAVRPLISGTGGDLQDWVWALPTSPDHAGDVGVGAGFAVGAPDADSAGAGLHRVALHGRPHGRRRGGHAGPRARHREALPVRCEGEAARGAAGTRFGRRGDRSPVETREGSGR